MLQMPISGSCVIDTKQLGRKGISCPQLDLQTKSMERLEKLFWNLSGIYRLQSLQRLNAQVCPEDMSGEKVCLGWEVPNMSIKSKALRGPCVTGRFLTQLLGQRFSTCLKQLFTTVSRVMVTLLPQNYFCSFFIAVPLLLL